MIQIVQFRKMGDERIEQQWQLLHPLKGKKDMKKDMGSGPVTMGEREK